LINVIRIATAEDLPQITHVRTSVLENHMSVEDLAQRGITPQTIIEQMNKGVLRGWVEVSRKPSDESSVLLEKCLWSVIIIQM